MTDAELLIDELRAKVREQCLTYRELGRRVGLSEVSIKRIFSTRRTSLDRLEDLCRAAGSSVFDLAARARRRAQSEVYHLSLEQERKLVKEVKLFYFFWMLIHRHELATIIRRFRLSDAEVNRYLASLDRGGFIDLREGNRYTINVPRNIVWNEDGPIERLVIAKSLPEFLRGKFKRDDEYFRFIIGKFTATSLARFREGLRELAEQAFEQSVSFDAMASRAQTVGLVVAVGPLSFSLKDVLSR